jgi:hypothetical protein
MFNLTQRAAGNGIIEVLEDHSEVVFRGTAKKVEMWLDNLKKSGIIIT